MTELTIRTSKNVTYYQSIYSLVRLINKHKSTNHNQTLIFEFEFEFECGFGVASDFLQKVKIFLLCNLFELALHSVAAPPLVSLDYVNCIWELDGCELWVM